MVSGGLVVRPAAPTLMQQTNQGGWLVGGLHVRAYRIDITTIACD